MRAIFGMVAVLLSCFIAVWMWATYTAESSRLAQPAIRQAERIAGRDERGMSIAQSMDLEPVHSPGGRFTGMKVTRLAPGGPMEKYYGLKLDDQIVSIGSFDARDYDPEFMQAWALEARGREMPLRIRRGEQVLELPAGKVIGGNTAPANTAAADTAEPAGNSADPTQPNQPPSTPKKDSTNTLNRQLQNIPGLR